MPKILVVEDDRDTASLISNWLHKEKYVLDVCHDGREGYEYLLQGQYDLIVLDWNLPGMTGVELCQKFRANGGTTPVLMLTGNTKVGEIEHGLDSGADDYLTKPFHMNELSARLRALMRRTSTVPVSVIKVGALEMDITGHKVYKAGVEVHLPPKEFSMLECLMRSPGKVFSTEALLSRVWSVNDDASEEAVRTAVRRIRLKLDDTTDESQSLIENVRRVGYRLRERS